MLYNIAYIVHFTLQYFVESLKNSKEKTSTSLNPFDIKYNLKLFLFLLILKKAF